MKKAFDLIPIIIVILVGMSVNSDSPDEMIYTGMIFLGIFTQLIYVKIKYLCLNIKTILIKTLLFFSNKKILKKHW